MHQQEPPEMTPEAKPNPERRNFLTRSLTGGLGLALLSVETARATDLNDAVCQAKPAVSDALAHYQSLLFSIQSDFYMNILGELGEATRVCSDLFRDLTAKIELLEKEVARSKQAQVRQMRELTELGSAHASLIRTSGVTLETTPALMTSLALVSEQVGRAAQDLLPAGENVLSAEASRLLNEIVRLVHESVPKQAKVREVQQRVHAQEEAIRTRLREIEKTLDEARQRAVVFDNPLKRENTAMQAGAGASAMLARVIEDLKALRPQLGNTPHALETLDLLVLLCEGTAQWLKDPDRVMAYNSGQPEGLDTALALASRAHASHAHRALADGVSTILASRCPPGSSMQTATCVTLVLLPVKGWSLFRHPSAADRINAVERSLRRMSSAFSCDSMAVMHDLAEDFVRNGLA